MMWTFKFFFLVFRIFSKFNYRFKNAHIIACTTLVSKKSYFEKNSIEVRNRKRTVLSTDEKIPILGDQNTEVCQFFDGFVL